MYGNPRRRSQTPRLVAELLVVLTQAQGITEVTGLLVGVLPGRPQSSPAEIDFFSMDMLQELLGVIPQVGKQILPHDFRTIQV